MKNSDQGMFKSLQGPEHVTGVSSSGKTTYLINKAKEIAKNAGCKPLIVAPYQGGVLSIKELVGDDPNITVETTMDVAVKCKRMLSGNMWGHDYETTWIPPSRLIATARFLGKRMGIDKLFADKAVWFIVAYERNGWEDEDYSQNLWAWFMGDFEKVGILIEKLYLEMEDNNVALLPMMFRSIIKPLEGFGNITGHTHLLLDDLQMYPFMEFDFLASLVGKNGNITCASDPNKLVRAHDSGGMGDTIERFKIKNPQAFTTLLESTNVSYSLCSINRNLASCGKEDLDDNSEKAKLYRTMHETKEAAKIIHQVMTVRAKYPDKKILITFRSDWYGRNIIKEALEADMDVDIRGYGNKNIAECFDVIADYLSLAINPLNGIAFLSAMNKPARRLGKSAEENLFLLRHDKGVTHWHDLVNIAHEVRGIQKAQITALGNFRGICRNLVSLEGDEIADYILNDIGVGDYLSEKYGKESKVAIDALKQSAKLSINPFECLERLEVLRAASTRVKGSKLVIAPISHVIGERFDYVWMSAIEDGIFPLSKDDTAYWNEDLEERDYKALYTAASRANIGIAFWSSYFRNINGKWKRTVLSPMILQIADLTRNSANDDELKKQVYQAKKDGLGYA